MGQAHVVRSPPCHRLDTANAGSDGRFVHYAKDTHLTRAARVSPTTKFHGITIQLTRGPANLHHSNRFPVFVAKKLHDVFTSLDRLIRHLLPAHRRVFQNPFIDQSFHVAQLIR